MKDGWVCPKNGKFSDFLEHYFECSVEDLRCDMERGPSLDETDWEGYGNEKGCLIEICPAEKVRKTDGTTYWTLDGIKIGKFTFWDNLKDFMIDVNGQRMVVWVGRRGKKLFKLTIYRTEE